MGASNNEKALASELMSILLKLPEKEQEHILWIGEGILVAHSSKEGVANAEK